MTEAQLDEKMEELFAETMEIFRESYKKVKKCGAIDINEWGDDYILPKLIMVALSKEAYFQWEPSFGDYDKDIKNIYRCM